MKASLKIEAIGDNSFAYIKLKTRILNEGLPGLGDLLGVPQTNYWVAMITGKSESYGYNRSFLKGKKDYKYSNGAGSRGVYVYYILESGYVYEVMKPITWNRHKRYFCSVTDDGEIIEVERSFVDLWVKDHSVSMY